MCQVSQYRQMLPEVKSHLDTRVAVRCILEHTEQIIDELEVRLQEVVPQVTHVTIEVQGLREMPSLSICAYRITNNSTYFLFFVAAI